MSIEPKIPIIFPLLRRTFNRLITKITPTLILPRRRGRKIKVLYVLRNIFIEKICTLCITVVLETPGPFYLPCLPAQMLSRDQH